MCRWMAYTGSPLSIEDLLYAPENSLIVQSLHAQLGVEPTNGDGFGVGWYGDGESPGGTGASSRPGTTGTCGSWPPRSGRASSSRTCGRRPVRRCSRPTATPSGTAGGCGCTTARSPASTTRSGTSLLAVDPALFPDIEGSTDSELFFYLALTFGLEDDPPAAVARAVGLIEDVGRRHGEEFPVQMTVATTDGETLWAFRYSSEGRSRSLFHSTDIATLRAQYPDNPVLHQAVGRRPAGRLRAARRAARRLAGGARSPPASCSATAREELRPFGPTVLVASG